MLRSKCQRIATWTLRGRGGGPISRAPEAGVLTRGRAEEEAKLAQEIGREDGRAPVPADEHQHPLEAVRLAN